MSLRGAHWRRSGGGPGGGCARGPVGTHAHRLLVVGASNPIAVPCLARLGARRGEIRRLRSADQQLSGGLSMGGFSKYYICTSVKISRSASMISFSRLDNPRILSRPRVGHVLDEFLGGEEGKGGSVLAAGVVASGGQPGSSAKVRPSLPYNHPYESRFSLRGKVRSYACRGRIAA
jgi:hypothetical protein